MKKEIEEIREALESLQAYDDETGEALNLLEEAIDEIDRHPEVGKVRGVIGETAEMVKTPGTEGAGVSGKWQQLRDHIDEWEDHHPKVTLAIGKMADALAVVGL